jgi:hypothetical protein
MEQYNNLTGAASSSIPTDTGGSGGSSFSGQLGGNALVVVLQVFSAVKENRKGLEAQANALRAKGLSEVEVARLMLEAEKLKAEATKSWWC